MTGEDSRPTRIARSQRAPSIGRRGAPGSALLRFVGSLPAEQVEKIARAIEEDCEQADLEGW